MASDIADPPDEFIELYGKYTGKPLEYIGKFPKADLSVLKRRIDAKKVGGLEESTRKLLELSGLPEKNQLKIFPSLLNHFINSQIENRALVSLITQKSIGQPFSENFLRHLRSGERFNIANVLSKMIRKLSTQDKSKATYDKLIDNLWVEIPNTHPKSGRGELCLALLTNARAIKTIDNQQSDLAYPQKSKNLFIEIKSSGGRTGSNSGVLDTARADLFNILVKNKPRRYAQLQDAFIQLNMNRKIVNHDGTYDKFCTFEEFTEWYRHKFSYKTITFCAMATNFFLTPEYELSETEIIDGLMSCLNYNLTEDEQSDLKVEITDFLKYRYKVLCSDVNFMKCVIITLHLYCYYMNNRFDFILMTDDVTKDAVGIQFKKVSNMFNNIFEQVQKHKITTHLSPGGQAQQGVDIRFTK